MGLTEGTDSPTVAESNGGKPKKADLSSFMTQERIAVVTTLLLILIFSTLLPGFRTLDNIISLVRNISLLGILGVGLAIVVIGRGIDLSIAATMAVTGAWTVTLINGGHSEPAAILLSLILVIAVGMINGWLVAFAEIPPIFVTLSTALIIYGLGQFVLIETLVVFLPQSASVIPLLGQSKILGFPVQIFVLAGVALVGHLLLSRTRWGLFTYAMGDNAETTRLSGVKLRPLTMLQYTAAGVIAFVAGLMLAGASPTFSLRIADGGILFDAVLVVVLGGVSLGGGSGSIFGVLGGTILLGTLLNGMTILDLSQQVQDLSKGVVLLLAIVVDALLHPRDEQTSRQSDI